MTLLQAPHAIAQNVWAANQEAMEALPNGLLGALETLHAQLAANEIYLCAFFGDYKRHAQLSANATGHAVTIQCEGHAEPYVLTYGSTAVFGLDDMFQNDRLMVCQALDGGPIYDGKHADEKTKMCLESAGATGTYKREVVRRFVTAWTILSKAEDTPPNEEESIRAEFQKVPAISADQLESLRRTQVQAELAIRENRTLDAARLYRDALSASPTWAAGEYNQALLLGELQFYPSAIRRMRAYLVLSPDATNARAARDLIYEWEARLPHATR
ncbi:MAG: hypothetical protein ABMA14_21415 [Hyphomonadaceae bacterium]